MPTLTWRGPDGGLWQDPNDWTSPNPGTFPPPPVPGDIAQVNTPSVIFGSGAADQLQTTNGSGLVELDGIFNIGTIFNGADMTLGDTVTSQFIETFVSLDLTGDISAIAPLSVPDNGIAQFNGIVTIDNGGSVDASEYFIGYNAGSLDQPNENALTLDGAVGGAWLDIATLATVDASNAVVGGFDISVAADVLVENGASLTTTYLTLGDPGAIMVVATADVSVLQTTTDPADNVAGIDIDGGELEIENTGSLFSTYLVQGGDDASSFIVDNATATIAAQSDALNGIEIHDGSVFFRNDSTISASQLYLGTPADPEDTDGPTLSITSSMLTITGTDDIPGMSFAGILLDGGQTSIGKASMVETPGLQIDSPEVADPSTDIGNFVTIDGGSTLSVTNDAILGVTGGSSVELDLSGDDTRLLFGDELVVADGNGDGNGANAFLSIDSGAVVSVNDVPDAQGLVAVGENEGDNGEIDVAGDGSKMDANDALVGNEGTGLLLADGGGSIDISGTLDVGDGEDGAGTLQVAGVDGPGVVSTDELDVGTHGDGKVFFDSLNGMNHGTLTVSDDAFVGVYDNGAGTVFGDGGLFHVGDDLYVGDEGAADVQLNTTTLDVGGDLLIGNAGTDTTLSPGDVVLQLQDVDLAVGDELVVGADGPGILDWGSTLDQSTDLDTVLIGDTENADGLFVLHDPTTILTVATLGVGDSGKGDLDVFNGAGLVVTGDAVIGDQDGSIGTIDARAGVDLEGDAYPNASSSLEFGDDLYVGDGGDGSLLLGGEDYEGDGASGMVKGDLIIGDEPDSLGFVYVANYDTASSFLTVDGDIYVGLGATGTVDAEGTLDPGGILRILNSATIDATADGKGFVDVAGSAGSSGSIDVDSSALFANSLVVGDEGDGWLTMDDGFVQISGTVVVANSTDATGTIDIDGDAQLNFDGDLIIGGGATAIVSDGTIDYPAVLDVTDGASVFDAGGGDDAFIIGADPHSLGKAIINGSSLDVNLATIGDEGSGVLEIENAGTATFNDDLILGGGSAAFGGMDVDASDVDFYGALDVGEDATGATINGTFIPGGLLTIENESTILDQGDDGIDIGVGAGSTGQMVVDDSDVETTSIVVGDSGTGTLTVRNDGTLSVDPDQDVEIASAPSSSGIVTIDGALLTYGSELVVGIAGNGSLTITNDGTVIPDEMATGTDLVIGDEATGTGSVTVDASYLDTDDIIIGNSGTGSLTIQNGGTVETEGDATIASEASSSGTATLIGLGGTVDDTLWHVAGQLTVGDLGTGSVIISAGATLMADDEFDIGNSAEFIGATGKGVVIASGFDTLIEANGGLFIGGDGQGTVALSGLAQLIATDDVTLGDAIGSKGSLLISGGTFIQTDGDVTVGEQGTGDIEVNGGGNFNAGTSGVTLGDTDLGKGTLNLTTNGGGYATAEMGDLTIGEEGRGSVSVMGGGQMTNTGDVVIGDTGDGTATIEGTNATPTLAPSTWTIGGDLSIAGLTTAGGGQGTLTVANGGIVHVAGEVVMWTQGSVIDNGATPGLIEIGGTTLTTGTGIVIDAATSVTAQGTLMGGGTIEANVIDNGLVDLTNGQTLVIDGAVSGTGTLLLDGASVLQVQGAIASTVSIDFDSGPGQTDVLELETPLTNQGIIYNPGSGDAIDLVGVKAAGAGFDIVNDVMTVTSGGGTVATLALGGVSFSNGEFTAATDGSGNLEIVFGTQAAAGTPTLSLPAELPAFPAGTKESLTGADGLYFSDPDAPINSTYTLTLNDQTGILSSEDTAQTDIVGASPIVLTGSLAEINAELADLSYTPSTAADTITVNLVRGDGATVTGAIGYDPAVSDPSIVDNGPTTVALGQAIALSLAPSDPIDSSPGNDGALSVELSTSTSTEGYPSPYDGYLLYDGQLTTRGYASSGTPLASLTASLGDGNLLFVPTQVGTVALNGELIESLPDGAEPSMPKDFTFNITVTAATRTKPVIDTWTGAAAAAVLSTAGNWSQAFAPGTTDTAVFAPVADVPVIVTTGDGVAALWDIDTSVSFTGVIDGFGPSSGAVAVDIDQGATVSLLSGAEFFAANLFEGSGFWYGGNFNGETGASGNEVIIGNTAPAFLTATGATLYTGETLIGNTAGAGGSRVTLRDSYWAELVNYQQGNTGNILVGDDGFGALDLIDSRITSVSYLNYEGTGFDQIQIGQNNGGLGVWYNSIISSSVQVGDFGAGELAMSGGEIGEYQIQYVSLAVYGGRVDWGGGASLDITDGLAGYSDATLDYGVISGNDWSINGEEQGQLTNNGTIEALAGGGGASTISSVRVEGSGTLLIGAGATLDLVGHTIAVSIPSGQTVVFAPEFNNAGGLLSIGNPNVFAGTIEGFADGDKLALGSYDSVGTVEVANFDTTTNSTSVVFDFNGSSTSTATIAFAGSIGVGDFSLDATQAAGATLFDYVQSGLGYQPPILAGPTDIAATDGVANPIPGLSLSDQDATARGQVIGLKLTSQNGGTFSAPKEAGLTIAGEDSTTITLTGALAVVQAELTEIDFTPVSGSDDTIQVTASDGASPTPAYLTIGAHNSANGNPQYTGTNNYIYTGPSTGSFAQPGSWQDAFGDQLPSGPGIADSATIVANTLQGGQDAIGGIGVAGQLLTEGLVVLTGSLTLAGLGTAGVGTIDGNGPAFAGALEDAQGNLIFGSALNVSLGGDLIVDGELDDLSDNPWSVAGNIHINGGTLALGGLGTVTASGTVEVVGTISTSGVADGGELDVIGDYSAAIYIGAVSSSPTFLTSAAGLIGTGPGTSVVNVGGSVAAGWRITGNLVVGASGDAAMTVESGSYTVPSVVSAAMVTIGQSAGAVGSLSVLSLSTLTVATTLIVGGAGDGTLDVSGQNLANLPDYGFSADVLVGSTASPGELDVGASAGGVGIVDITLPGAVTIDGSAYIGGTSAGASGGTGTVEVSGASFSGTYNPSPAGLLDVTGGLTVYNGTLLLHEGTAAVGGLTIDAGATLSGDGVVTGPTTASAAPLTTILDNGLIDASVDPGNGAALLTLYGDITGDGTLEIAAGATVDIEGSVAASVHVMFEGPGSELILDQPANFGPVIGGFQEGDELRLPGITPGRVTYDPATGALADTVGVTVYNFTLDPPLGPFVGASDTHDGTLLEIGLIPVITAPPSATVGEGQPSPISDLSVVGTSAETGDTFTVTLADGAGLLSATGAGVAGDGTSTLTITGSQTDVNAVLATVTDTDATTASDTITATASDQTQDVPAQSVTLPVTVNGIPVITVPGATMFEADVASSISGIALAESGNNGSEPFTVTVSDASGAFTVTPNGAVVTGSGSNDLTITGFLSNVNAALYSLTDTESIAGSDTITVNASDGFGNIATEGTISVATNSQPELLVSIPTLYLGVAISGAIGGVTLSEGGDTSNVTFTVNVQDTDGSLFANEGNISVEGKDLNLGGTLSEVQADLASLTDTYQSYGTDTITLTAYDDYGGVSPTQTIAVSVSDRPNIAVPYPVTLNPGQTTPIPGIDLTEANTAPDETFTVVLSDADGILTVNTGANGGGGTITSTGGGTTLTIGGTLGQLNADLTTLADNDPITGSDTITINLTDSFGNVALTNAIPVTSVQCFTAGTRIKTASGPVPVQALMVGDEVATVLGDPNGRPAGRIVWAGRRAIDCARHPRPESVWPVRIARGAFGANLPSRALYVSPDHALYVDGVLIPAKHLINGASVCQVKRRLVVYHHIELAEHNVVLAEGLPAETYLDAGDRTAFSGGRVVALYPEFAARTWEMKGCAPLVVHGPVVEAVKARLAAERASRKARVRRG